MTIPMAALRSPWENIRNQNLALLGDFYLVQFRPCADRFFAAGQGFGNGFEGHALFRKGMKLLDFFAGPCLLVAFKMFFHGL